MVLADGVEFVDGQDVYAVVSVTNTGPKRTRRLIVLRMSGCDGSATHVQGWTGAPCVDTVKWTDAYASEEAAKSALAVRRLYEAAGKEPAASMRSSYG